MFYLIRRRSDDLYLTKDERWVKDFGKNCWFTKEQIENFKELNEPILNLFMIYIILNPSEKSDS